MKLVVVVLQEVIPHFLLDLELDAVVRGRKRVEIEVEVLELLD